MNNYSNCTFMKTQMWVKPIFVNIGSAYARRLPLAKPWQRCLSPWDALEPPKRKKNR